RTLAGGLVGRGRATHARTRDCLRAYRRICVVPLRAKARRVCLGVARSGDEYARRRWSEDRARHADSDAAQVADGRISGDCADRRAGAAARFWLPPPPTRLVPGFCG